MAEMTSWRSNDIAYLKLNYLNYTNEEIALHLGRTILAVKKRRSILNLNRPNSQRNLYYKHLDYLRMQHLVYLIENLQNEVSRYVIDVYKKELKKLSRL